MIPMASPNSPEEISPYIWLQQQMHDALRAQHPDWIQADGECPTCEAYESRLSELLRLSSVNEHSTGA
jgi:hypothetical protein